MAIGAAQGYLPPEHYNQIFSAHGTIMIFFVAMPFVIGFMNFVVPLQLGVRDVAFPTMNNVSFWLTRLGRAADQRQPVHRRVRPDRLAGLSAAQREGILARVSASIIICGAADIRGRDRLNRRQFRDDDPQDPRAGMSYLRMPIFCWTALASNLLILAAFPVLTATLALLMLDRYLGFHFFTNDGGGNSMIYMNLIWVWGHPEVYILVLPAFGIFSEVASTFLRQAAVRLPVDGLRDDGHLHRLLHGLAAPLLHHGRGRQRQRHLRHRQHDHRHPDGREDLQLAVHHVRRPRPLPVPMLWSIGFMSPS